MASAVPLMIVLSGIAAALSGEWLSAGSFCSGRLPTTNARGFEMPKRPVNRAS